MAEAGPLAHLHRHAVDECTVIGLPAAHEMDEPAQERKSSTAPRRWPDSAHVPAGAIGRPRLPSSVNVRRRSSTRVLGGRQRPRLSDRWGASSIRVAVIVIAVSFCWLLWTHGRSTSPSLRRRWPSDLRWGRRDLPVGEASATAVSRSSDRDRRYRSRRRTTTAQASTKRERLGRRLEARMVRWNMSDAQRIHRAEPTKKRTPACRSASGSVDRTTSSSR